MPAGASRSLFDIVCRPLSRGERVFGPQVTAVFALLFRSLSLEVASGQLQLRMGDPRACRPRWPGTVALDQRRGPRLEVRFAVAPPAYVL